MMILLLSLSGVVGVGQEVVYISGVCGMTDADQTSTPDGSDGAMSAMVVVAADDVLFLMV